MNRLSIFSSLIFLFVLSCGIGDIPTIFQINDKLVSSKEKREKGIKSAVENKEAKKDALPEELTIAAQVRYEYSSVGKNDPFNKKDVELKLLAEEKIKKKEVNPLELFEINQFKLVGTLSSTTNPMALLAAPDSKSYLVKIGTIVGKNRGYVTNITKYSVVIAHDYRDATGATQKKSTILNIKTEEEERLAPTVSGGE